MTVIVIRLRAGRKHSLVISSNSCPRPKRCHLNLRITTVINRPLFVQTKRSRISSNNNNSSCSSCNKRKESSRIGLAAEVEIKMKRKVKQKMMDHRMRCSSIRRW